MIQVVALSPAIDVTYRVDSAALGAQHRVIEVVRRAGGKALNVSSVLGKLSTPSRLILPLGGAGGEWISSRLTQSSVTFARISTQAPTRQCLTIVDADSATEFNEPPPVLTAQEVETMMNALGPSDVTIFSGSISCFIDPLALSALFSKARDLSEVVIVDTSGGALRLASQFADYVKPNSRELREIAGDDRLESALQILNPATVILSRAEGGVTLYGADTLSSVGPIQKGNSTGAGDAFVAGFASRLHRGTEAALHYAVAVAGASVSSPTAGEVDMEIVATLFPQIEVRNHGPRTHQ